MSCLKRSIDRCIHTYTTKYAPRRNLGERKKKTSTYGVDAHQIRHGDYEKQRIHKELHRGGMVLPVVVDAIDAIAAIGSGGGALLFDANKKK